MISPSRTLKPGYKNDMLTQIVYTGTVYRHLGFTGHPQYLEVAESMGLIDVWEQRGPPDFREKVDGQWICE